MMTDKKVLQNIRKQIQNKGYEFYSQPPRCGKTILTQLKRNSFNCSDSVFDDDEMDMLRIMFQNGIINQESLTQIIRKKLEDKK